MDDWYIYIYDVLLSTYGFHSYRYYMKEKEIERAQTKKKKDEIFGPLRGIQLRDYVHAVRTQLHETRLREKKERFNQALQAYVLFFLFSF